MSWQDIGEIALAMAAPEAYMGLQKYRENQDFARLQSDRDLIQKNPSYVPDYSAYRTPGFGMKAQGVLQQLSAQPVLTSAKSQDYPEYVNYIQKTGTTDPRFFNDPASREELKSEGFGGDIGVFSKPLPSNNPDLLSGISALQGKAQTEANMRDYLSGSGGANSIAALLADDSNKQHVAAVRAVRSDFNPVTDTQTPADREFLASVYGKAATAETPQDVLSLITADAQKYQPSIPVLEKATQHLTGSNFFESDKPVTPPAPHQMHFSDGTVQDMRWNPVTQKDEPYGERYKPTAQQKIEMPQIPKPGRMYSVLDTQQGNMPIMMPAEELAAAHKTEPGRYISASTGTAALNKTALIEDMRGTVNDVREALKTMPPFTSKQAAQFSVALNDRNPESAMRSFITSGIGKSLNPTQQTYLIRLAQLHENAMALRPVLGAGQGSDDVRRAIRATIPSASTPTNAYALEQLNRFETTLNRLGRGVPTVPLRKEQGATPVPAAKTVVERRQTRDGKILVKYSDGTIGQQ